MDAVITKRQKNTIMVLGAIAGGFGAISGASGLFLRVKYLMFDQNWDVDVMPGFTQGYFGVMSGFLLLLLGTVGCGFVYSRTFCMVFIYWLCSLSCDTLCVLDLLMIIPYTKDNGKFAWEPQIHNCTLTLLYPGGNDTMTYSNTYLSTNHLDYCKDIKVIAILLVVITAAISTSLLFSCCTTLVTSVALCRARSIANEGQGSIQLAPFSIPDHFQPMSFNNTVYHSDTGFRK